MVDGAAVAAANLPAAVAVVGRAGVGVAARRLPTAPALEPRVAAQRRREYVVQIDVADDEQRAVPRSGARPAP